MPGRLEFVYLTIAFVMFLASCAQAQTETEKPLQGLVVVCDLDYTLLDYNDLREPGRISSRGWLRESVSHIFNPPKAVAGMPELLQDLEKRGAKIIFVSARPMRHMEFVRKLIDRMGFAAAEIKLASYTAGSTLHYKIETIAPILEQHKNDRVILIGDNLDYDIQAYAHLASSTTIVNQVMGVFIRSVKRGVKLARGQFKFRTTVELAQYFFDAGLISQAHALSYGGSLNTCMSLFN